MAVATSGTEHNESVCGERLPRDVRALERGELHWQLFEHRMGEHRAVGDQDGAGHRVVLGLSEEVGGDQLRVGGFVGDQQRLGRARQLIDVDDAEDASLGQHDEDVARPVDLVDVRNSFRTVRHRRDGLRATDAEDAIDACHFGGRQHQGRDLPVRSRGVQTMISCTPATRAGTAVISSDDG